LFFVNPNLSDIATHYLDHEDAVSGIAYRYPIFTPVFGLVLRAVLLFSSKSKVYRKNGRFGVINGIARPGDLK
jgi:hypothetical protein